MAYSVTSKQSNVASSHRDARIRLAAGCMLYVRLNKSFVGIPTVSVDVLQIALDVSGFDLCVRRVAAKLSVPK